jgi:hypothetical protein
MDDATQTLIGLLQTIRSKPTLFLWNPDDLFAAPVNFICGYLQLRVA